MSHFIVSSLPPFENCQGSVEDDISQRGKKKTVEPPYLLLVHEKHSSANLTLSVSNVSSVLPCLFGIMMDAKKRAWDLESDDS